MLTYDTPSLRARFWAKVDKSGDCWLWTAHRGWKNYGRFQIGNKSTAAHRISYELTYGPIPDGLWVLHRCDNPPCVNPEHLFLGTNLDNMRDAAQKGRLGVLRGETIGTSKLTDDMVREIRHLRAEGWTLRSLAARFNVCKHTIEQVTKRRRWKHIE